MNYDAVLRIAAVVAAAALLAAPYWAQIQAAAHRAMEAGKEKAGFLARIAAAGLLVAAAWGKVPLPQLPAAPVGVKVETPSDDMKRLVSPIADALKGLPMSDRMLWAEVWTKAGVVVAGDAIAREVAFSDSRSLRAYTALAMDIAWRRIGKHEPDEIPGLRDAVEGAYNAAMGREVLPVDKAMRDRYVALANAIAWAGVNGG